jgi:hypothetical protein
MAITPEDFRPPSSSELRAVGVTARSSLDCRDEDPLQRFKAVPNHAMFLYTSEDRTLGAYIHDHWDALDGLSGDICDIHESLLQLRGEEDAYSQLKNISTIAGMSAVKLTDLPAIHIWSKDAYCTLSLKLMNSELKIRDFFRFLFTELIDIGGPITNDAVSRLNRFSLDAYAIDNPGAHNHSGGQSVDGCYVGGNLVQIIYRSGPNWRETTMSEKPRSGSGARGQSISDASTKGKIGQISENLNDSQNIQKVQAEGSITQTKSQKSTMSIFGWGTGTGYGIIALVIVVIAFLLYHYLSSN